MDPLVAFFGGKAQEYAESVDRAMMKGVERRKRQRVFEDMKRRQQGEPVPVIVDAYGCPLYLPG